MEHQLHATITVLLISKISSTCFGQTFAHLQERKTEIVIQTYGIMSCLCDRQGFRVCCWALRVRCECGCFSGVCKISISLSIMPCSTVSSLAISTRSSAYFTVLIICPPVLKSPSPSRASLVRHSLYKLNRIGDKQHLGLTPLPICTRLDSPWSSRTLTL
jgi:hypothetical protein